MLIFITKHIANLIITSAYMEKIHLPPIDTTCQPVKKKKKNPTIFSCSIPECDVFPTHLHTIHLTPSTLTHTSSHTIRVTIPHNEQPCQGCRRRGRRTSVGSLACQATYPVLCHVVLVGYRQPEPPRETVGVRHDAGGTVHVV